MNGLRLRDLDFGARFALTLLVLVLAGGLAASAFHLVEHHQNRDEQPGVSLEDLEGAYHGVDTTAPLVMALERGHPNELAESERATLLKWLGSKRISEDYDNLDLGDAAPAELIQRGCVQCHAKGAKQGDGIGETLPLSRWDEIKPLAFSKQLSATPVSVLAASTHAHALSLGVLSIVIGLLLLATRWSAFVRNGLFAVAALALFADLASWWLARESASFVLVIAAAGLTYGIATALSLVAIVLDLWLPKRV
jgi:hypothetical protein